MKKYTLLYLFLCAIPTIASAKGGPTLVVEPAAGAALLLPRQPVDFSDLDARDGQNQRVQDPSAIQRLQDLFRENLLNLTVLATPHGLHETLSWLDAISHLFNKHILIKLPTLFRLLQEAIFPPNRRFVHNVHKLCITFTVGVFASFILPPAFTLLRTPKTLPLRC